MNTFSPLQQLGIVVLSLLILTGSIWVVWLKNLFRAALSLGLVLLGVAGLFLVLEAEFLALAQILVYVGAILILLIFAVMLTATAKGDALSLPAARRLSAAAMCTALFAILVTVCGPIVSLAPEPTPAVPLTQVGQELVTTLVLPFELISVVFVAAIVGAVAVAATKTRTPSS